MNFDKIVSVNEMKQQREKAKAEYIAKYKERCIQSINKLLYDNGKVNYIFYYDQLPREASIALAQELNREYQEQGYETWFEVYAESNREKACQLIVWIL